MQAVFGCTIILVDWARLGLAADEEAALRAKVAALAAPRGGGRRHRRPGRMRWLRPMPGPTPRRAAPSPRRSRSRRIWWMRNAGTAGLRGPRGQRRRDPLLPPRTRPTWPTSTYVPPVRDNTASQASLKLGYVLGQDRYGAAYDISVKGNLFPFPDLPVGRLVETAPGSRPSSART
ncbi:MAG: hypothetical protein R2838_17030 [Caldilineaceae bacterium]